ncbi:GIY-YIG nuclease family protein [Aurantimonas sp. NFXS3]|uniref:GIY-YIG nuclease family protein n=1 Tax=Aurantimonas sp. NFXS3 TaxID=2818434 RepID=UPI003B8E9210
MAELSDLEILEELGVEPIRKTKTELGARDVRIIAGFEDIQKFVEEHGRVPEHGADRDIFERIYAVRLDRLRSQADCVALLRDLDLEGLLKEAADDQPTLLSELDDDIILATLGVGGVVGSDLTELRHVRSPAERRAAEEIAVRQPCADFETFAPLFQAVKQDLERGTRQSRRFERRSEIEQGRLFIVEGLLAYVAEAGEEFLNDSGNRDRRLRVVYDNGTENNLLARSLQKALTQDPAGRRIIEPDAGPLFHAEAELEGTETGTIYVLRSLSGDPRIAEMRDVLHKIGVTGGSVDKRVARAEFDPTFLMAPVEIVATFRLIDINRTALENLLHRFFAPGALDLKISDRFGNPIRPREWFIVPLTVIREAVEHLQGGHLHRYEYAPTEAKLVLRDAAL